MRLKALWCRLQWTVNIGAGWFRCTAVLRLQARQSSRRTVPRINGRRTAIAVRPRDVGVHVALDVDHSSRLLDVVQNAAKKLVTVLLFPTLEQLRHFPAHCHKLLTMLGSGFAQTPKPEHPSVPKRGFNVVWNQGFQGWKIKHLIVHQSTMHWTPFTYRQSQAELKTALSYHCLLSEDDRHSDCKSLTVVTLTVLSVRT